MKRLAITLLTCSLLFSACSPVAPPEPEPEKDISALLEGKPGSEGPYYEEEAVVYLSVHVEPQTPQSMITQAPYVAELVALADEYEFPLTLMFSSPWQNYYLNNEAALSELNGWEDAGHEIAVHHHGLSHPAWDGYTNVADHENDTGYKGDMNDFMNAMGPLSQLGVVTGSMTDEDTDWPVGLPYATDGYGVDEEHDFVSGVETVFLNGTEVLQVRKIGYANDKPVDNELETIEAVFADMEAGDILGVNTSDTHLSEGGLEEIEALFQSLQASGLSVTTVRELLSTY